MNRLLDLREILFIAQTRKSGRIIAISETQDELRIWEGVGKRISHPRAIIDSSKCPASSPIKKVAVKVAIGRKPISFDGTADGTDGLTMFGPMSFPMDYLGRRM